MLSPPTGEAVSDSVERHLDTGWICPAGQQPDRGHGWRSDIEREEHRKKTFDRQIGSLTDTSRSEPSPSAAGEAQPAGANARAIANLLAKPESVRQAIVLNEILNRPEDRWVSIRAGHRRRPRAQALPPGSCDRSHRFL